MKRGFVGHTWAKILVFKDDTKSFETFELNEEQKLKIPLKTVNKRPASSIDLRKKMQEYGINSKNSGMSFEFNSQVIFTVPGTKQQNDETPKTDIVDQVFDKFSINDIFGDINLKGSDND